MSNENRATQLREEGNVLFKARDYQGAIEKYSQAIDLTPSNAVLYYNRAAAFEHLNDHVRAREDAAKCVKLDKYSTAKYSLRLAQILVNMDKLVDAIEILTETFATDESLSKLMTKILHRIDNEPEQTNINRLIKQIDDPGENWTRLTVLSQYNDRKIGFEDLSVVSAEGGVYRNGCRIERIDTGYKWTGMTVIEGQQVWNFDAYFDHKGNFVKGWLNADYYGKKVAMEKRYLKNQLDKGFEEITEWDIIE